MTPWILVATVLLVLLSDRALRCLVAAVAAASFLLRPIDALHPSIPGTDREIALWAWDLSDEIMAGAGWRARRERERERATGGASVVLPAVAVLLIALAAVTGVACSHAQGDRIAGGAYGAQLAACRTGATTRADAVACYARVRANWSEAGAPPAAPLDGGVDR